MTKYKSAVIGLGQIGLTYDFDIKRTHPASHVLAYSMNEDIDLKAVMDINTEKKDEFKYIGINTTFYTDMNELLSNNELDIVSVCTPPSYHLENIKSIIERSKAKIIFCEKPIVKEIEDIALLSGYMLKRDVLIVPNISRRWSSSMNDITKFIQNGQYGKLEKIYVRYTRGIYNSGAHIFDLLHMWAGKMQNVQVLKKVYTTSEKEKEPTYSFIFHNNNGVYGVFEAFNDEQYYMFEIDLFFQHGKIEVRDSGNVINYYSVTEHSLFSGFKGLNLERKLEDLLKESVLKYAVENLVNVLNGREKSKCSLSDAIYPLYVAQALERSYQNNTVEKVVYYE